MSAMPDCKFLSPGALLPGGVFCVLLGLTGCNLQGTIDHLPGPQASTDSTEPVAVISSANPSPITERAREKSVTQGLLLEIQTGLALPQYESSTIDQQLNWHRRNPDYLLRVWNRSRPYLFHVVSEIKRRELPLELALLPIVESGYQPYGYSHARAAGLWQFIPSTGRHFGLRQNWWSDQRRDVIASTDAALTYLQQLHQRFDGDWLLAIAAYNAGAGRIDRAIRATGLPRSQVHFEDLSLSRETREYVPKLLALARVIRSVDGHDLNLPTIEDEPYFAVINIGQQTDLGKISDLAGITIDQLRRLNPAFNRWATDPEGPHRVLVPIASAAPLEAGLQRLSDSERLQWRRHVIKPGENLASIARKYGLSVAVIQQSNQLKDALIRAGDDLLLPSVASLPTPLAASCRGERLTHRVRAGDTLWDLARRYDVSVNHLKRCNPGLSSANLALGSDIRIRDPNNYALTPTPPAQARVDKVVNYRVRKGDSLAAISSRFGVSVRQLVAWNSIDPEQYLQPGDQLVVRLNLLDRG